MADTPYQGFIGATCGGDARHLDAEQCINLYPEPTGAPGITPKRPLALRHTPGLKVFGMAGNGPVRGMFFDPGVERLFCISGGKFFEVGEGGAATKLGDVATGVLPVTWASNGVGGQQIMFTSGGRGYIFDLASDTFHVIEAEYFPANVIACAYIHTYFLALPSNSRQFHYSALFNGLEWSAGDVAQKSNTPDVLRELVVHDDVIRLIGSRTTETWDNSDNALTPFAPMQGAIINLGMGPLQCVQFVGGALIVLGSSQDGGAGEAWAPQGRTFQLSPLLALRGRGARTTSPAMPTATRTARRAAGSTW